MKVVHAIPSLDRRYGGPAFAFVNFLESLKEVGIDVEAAVTFKDTDDMFLVERLRKSKIKVNLLGPTTSSLGWHRRLRSFTGDLVESSSVVHLHGVFELVHAYFASHCVQQRVPFIVRPFGVLSKFALAQKSIRKRICLKTWACPVLREASVYHLASYREKAELGVDLASSRIRVVANGCIAQRQVQQSERLSVLRQLNIPENFNLFLGRIHPIKGLEVLIHAYRSLPDSIPPLVVVGHGDRRYIAKLQTLVRQLGLSGRIFWIKDVYGEFKNAVFQSATAFLLPSAHENFANAALESVSMGIPVVISEVAGFSEFVSKLDLGIVCNRTASDFAAAIIQANQMFVEPTYRVRAQETVLRQFAWSKIATEWQQMYLDLVR